MDFTVVRYKIPELLDLNYKCILNGLIKEHGYPKELEVSEKVVPAIFEGIHQSRKKAFSDDEIKALFVEAGIAADKFDKTINSLAIKAHTKKMQKNTAAIRSLGYSGVPTLVIHGKYVPNIKALKSFEEYVELVVFLANKKTD